MSSSKRPNPVRDGPPGAAPSKKSKSDDSANRWQDPDDFASNYPRTSQLLDVLGGIAASSRTEQINRQIENFSISTTAPAPLSEHRRRVDQRLTDAATDPGNDQARAKGPGDKAMVDIHNTIEITDQGPVTQTKPVTTGPLGPQGQSHDATSSSTVPSLASLTERVLGKYLTELTEDNEHWTRAWMREARHAWTVKPRVIEPAEKPAATPVGASAPKPAKKEPPPYSFADYKPIQVVRTSKTAPPGHHSITVVNEKNKQKTYWSVPVTYFTSKDTQPEYAHYIHVDHNFLAGNDPIMRCWPYFHDDFDMETMAETLKTQYHIDIEQRPRKLLRLLQAEKCEDYVRSALEDLGIDWSDLLSFLLEESPNVGNDGDALRATAKRREYCNEDFPSRTSNRSIKVLSSLPPTDHTKLGKAACLFESFQRMARFPLWHVVRRHLFDYIPTPEPDLASIAARLTCKVCLRFNCPYHGEIRQYDASDGEDEDRSPGAVDSAIEGDIINPPQRNFRTRVAFAPFRDVESYDDPVATPEPVRRPGGHLQNQYIWEPDKRQPFQPCHHPGSSCEDARCLCFRRKINCERICSCSLDCARRWTGCNCSQERVVSGHRLMCFADDRCACFKHARECDPDLCGSCRVHEVVDPLNRDDDSILVGRCRNASIQRGIPKATLLGQSNIHGFGLYAGENVKIHEFLGEYKGEIITAQEAERRGAVYEHQKLSYLFSLNMTQEIDSTYYGNKIRFINHAREARANLYPRIMLVNTVHRIALYASRPIARGAELFFDYGPKFPEDQLGGGTGGGGSAVVMNHGNTAVENSKKGKAATPRVRNSLLVLEEFHDVVVSEDEHGNRRARKAAVKRKGRKAGVGPSSNAAGAGAGAGAGGSTAAATAVSKKKKRGKKRIVEDDEDEDTSEPQSDADHRMNIDYIVAGTSRHLGGPDREKGASAGERLAAYNISDETSTRPSQPQDDAMIDDDDDESEDYREDDEGGDDDDEDDDDEDEYMDDEVYDEKPKRPASKSSRARSNKR